MSALSALPAAAAPAAATAAAFRSPPGTWLKGHADAFFADKIGFLSRCAREYGEIVPLRFGPFRMYLVSDPQIVGEIYTAHPESFRKSIGLQRARAVVGDGLLTSEGAAHARRSRIAQPAFRQREVESYAPAMVDLTERIVAAWPDGARIDVAHEMSRLTLAIAARTLFGADLLEDADGIGEALTELLDLLDERLARLIPIPLWLPLPGNRRFNRSKAVLDAAVLKIIRERRAALAAGRSVPADLLSRLLAPPASGDAGLTDEELKDEVMTLILAGHETTANALAFTFLLLAKHPEAAARIRAEAAAALGDRSPTAADAAHLPYTAQVFAEAMRLYPPAWMTTRQAVEDVALGGGKLPLRKGEIVAMSPWVMHRLARFWPEPDAFRPERFDRDAPRPTPYTYIPFGGGKRACIGRSFALLEGALVLPTILRAVDLEIDPAREPKLVARVTLRAEGGIPATVRRRG